MKKILSLSVLLYLIKHMEIQAYIEKKKEVQRVLLSYLDEGNEKDYIKLIELLTESNITKNRDELKSTLQLISSIADNHHRSPYFISGIEKILNHYKSDIEQSFSNTEIFNIFNSNKLLLLFLLQEKLILPENILSKEKDEYFLAYFYPEIESKITENEKTSLREEYKELDQNFSPELFDQKRKIGENDSYICTLIRNDSIEDFIAYSNKQNFPLSSTCIPLSIFETNSFLIQHEKITLIEYATFYGSYQIIQYLRTNKVEFNPSIWLYAIHGSNAEMIQMLEDSKIKKSDTEYEIQRSVKNFHLMLQLLKIGIDQFFEKYSLNLCLKEAILCHHNGIYEYFIANKPRKSQEEEEEEEDDPFEDNQELKNKMMLSSIEVAIFESRNYFCFPNDLNKDSILYYLIEFDYTEIVKLLLIASKDKDINRILI